MIPESIVHLSALEKAREVNETADRPDIQQGTKQ